MNVPFRPRRALAVTAAAALGIACLPLAACSSDAGGSDSSQALSVAASFYPIQYLAQAVGGEHVNVTSVTPTNVEPHDYELAPKDVTALSGTDLVVYVPGFQPSLDDALSEVSGPDVLDLTDAVELTHHDGVEHDHDDARKDAHDDSHDDSHNHDGDVDAHGDHADEADADHAEEHDADAADPHFWLDPVRMQSAAQAIETALSQADPNHADDYQANLSSLTETLEGLDSDYSTGLAQCERTTFVTSHAAFGYLADRYGLTQASVSGVDPESEPSPAELAAVKKIVQETGTTTIFTEDLVSSKTADALAAETGATTAVLNPLESAPSSGDYADAMSANLQELRTALSCQ
ncbi:metal ABC transporter substrate-binding protein [Actinomyces sp. 565]|uniref:metal ABC transporter substrate-binding protein n=1 Tax=Actinomyces sp. 565 TaxID=2057794 RepID=UPI0013A69281|nr:metal ABC transporter substrate-binding protein [Actinomyces sp. 565]NDR52472.1 zinc ABC transporter substrate-binding protein [Actinomyces sp. 565]